MNNKYCRNSFLTNKMFLNLPYRPFIFFFLILFFDILNINASTINVASISALQTAINSAASGDIIKLSNGHYTDNTLTISKSNITVQAATTGGVYMDGNNNITLSGNNITFIGFQFTTNNMSGGLPVESPTNAVTVSGNNNAITQLNFNGYFCSKMIQISGLNNLVSYCNFQNKWTDTSLTKGGDGDMLQIIPNATNPGNNVIRYCSFQHMPGGGGDWGNECIRIGDGAYSLMISRTVVEYCYFEDTGHGDSEAISVKSRENILRYNTMNNNPDAMFAFRNGDNNVAYGNFFIKSGGFRCKQANNIYCYNNYFESAGTNQTSGLSGSGTAPILLEYYGTGYGDNFNFIHNTFYGCTANIIPTQLTNVTWANNIFYKSSPSIFSGTTSGQSFAGNIYNQSTVGLTIASGMTNTNPSLALNSDGYYGITTTTPAASAVYPKLYYISGIDTLLLDIQGQTRPVARISRDLGCEEYNATGTVINKPLTLSNVGPSYLGGPSTLQNQTITFNALPSKSVGNADFAPGATASSGLTVTYSSSNSAVATIVSNQIHIVGVGTTTITASQAGDGSTYNAAPDVTQTLTVSKASQTITFNSLATKTILDSDFAPGATASSGLTVTYLSSNLLVATIVSNQIHIVGVGTTTITASQVGNSSYLAASDVSQTLTVNKQSQTITFAALSSKTTTDVDFSPGATASSGLTVTYSSLNSAVATIVSNQIHIIGVGTTTITASQGGNSSYLAASDVIRTLTVNKQSQTITFAALSSKTTTDVDFSPGATATSSLTVIYSSSNLLVATIINNQIHIVGAGTTTITASQGGNSSYDAAPDVTQQLTVTAVIQNQTITFNSITPKSTTDADFNPGATSSSGLTVSYTSSNPLVATIINNQIHIVGAGTSTITALQAGNGSYYSAIPVNQTLTVYFSTTVTLNPGDDSYVSDSNPTTNYGTVSDILIKKGNGTANDRFIYLKFKISGQNIYSLTSSKVRMYVNTLSVPSPIITVTASQTSNAWNENTLCYNNRPIKGTDIVGTVVNAAATYYEWDVTSYVQSQLTANADSISLFFSDLTTGTTIAHFNSKEASTNKPELVLNFNKTYSSQTITNNTNLSAMGLTNTQLSNTDFVVSAGELTIDQNATIHSIMVSSGSKLTLNSGQTLSVVNLSIQSNLSNGTGTFVDKNGTGGLTVSGTTNVQQYISSGRNWYISSPVGAATSNVFSASVSNPLYWYDESKGSTTPWTPITTTDTTLGILQGYITNLGTSGAVTFSGSLNTGSQQKTLYRTDTQSKAGFNLVGNPYPSYLDWSLASTVNSGVLSTIWYRTKTSSSNPTYTFDTYNATGNQHTNNGSTTVSNLIPPMQAFWVRVNSGQSPATLIFTNAMRSHADVGTNSIKAPKAINSTAHTAVNATNTPQPLLRLQISNGMNSDETVLYFDSNATNGYDDYDSPKMSNNSLSIPELYTQAGMEQLSINGLRRNDGSNSIIPDQEIPLGFTTGESNTFSIKASEISNFETGTKIVLKDYLLHTEQELTNSSSYSFTSDAVSTIGRFGIEFKSASVPTSTTSIASGNGDYLTVLNDKTILASQVGSMEVYNLQGEQVISAKNTNKLITTLSSGLYIVRFTNNQGQSLIQKICIQ
jgi:hypothetical protein